MTINNEIDDKAALILKSHIYQLIACQIVDTLPDIIVGEAELSELIKDLKICLPLNSVGLRQLIEEKIDHINRNCLVNSNSLIFYFFKRNFFNKLV